MNARRGLTIAISTIMNFCLMTSCASAQWSAQSVLYPRSLTIALYGSKVINTHNWYGPGDQSWSMNGDRMTTASRDTSGSYRFDGSFMGAMGTQSLSLEVDYDSLRRTISMFRLSAYCSDGLIRGSDQMMIEFHNLRYDSLGIYSDYPFFDSADVAGYGRYGSDMGATYSESMSADSAVIGSIRRSRPQLAVNSDFAVSRGGDGVSVWPNPGSSEIRVSGFGSDVSNLDIKLFDILGRMIVPPSLLASGGGEAVLDVSSVPEGMYYMRIAAGGLTSTRRVVILR